MKLTFRNAVGYHWWRYPSFTNVTPECFCGRTIGESVPGIAGRYALQSLVSGNALYTTISRRFQFPIDARRRLDRNLEVASCSITAGVCRVYRDIFKVADSNYCTFRYESDFHRAGCVRGVDAFSCLIEIDGVTLLSIDQFDNVALRTAQFWWSYICNIRISINFHIFIS